LGITRRLLTGATALAIALAAGRAAAASRVFSLDQCADQYVLALSPPAEIVGLSPRADDADSYLRSASKGLPLRRADLESVLASRAEVAVRYWGGDELMTRRLAERGVAVVKIDEATDFAGVRANVRRVALALGRPDAGEALIARMDGELSQAKGAWAGQRVLYLTPAGFTAGRRTLIGAMIAAAGLADASPLDGYGAIRLERLVADPPAGFVLGFFDKPSMAGQWWSIGRHEALRRITAGRTLARLPASILGCPAWFAADGALALARARPRIAQ
jgi:iron complex transport system substrate-binding protein